MVALFIAETEYIVVGSYVTQTMWLRIKLSELQHYQNKLTKIFYNNENIIALIKNPVFHGQGKHIDIKNHYIFYLVKDKKIMAEFCLSKDQVANIFINTLKIDLFLKFKKMMCIKKFEELGLREGFNNYLNQVSM
jgi:hypothetical protein